MLEYHLDVDALATTSFACSPLVETVLSLRARRAPDLVPEHKPFLARTAAAFARLDTELLMALITPERRLPDYLTPRPPGPSVSFADGIAALRAVAPEAVAEHIRIAYAHEATKIPPVLADGLADPAQLAARIAAVLEDYWHACIEPHWPGMASVLVAEISYRARQLADGGARELFTDLDRRLSWDSGVLSLDLLGTTGRVLLQGTGLTLVPSLFARGAICMITHGPDDFLVYPARGRGSAWAQPPPPEPAAALAGLLGPARARLLEMLDRPASTTELARALNVTPSAVSQHLAALHAARLVSRSRLGRSVLYLRTALGSDLAGEPAFR